MHQAPIAALATFVVMMSVVSLAEKNPVSNIQSRNEAGVGLPRRTRTGEGSAANRTLAPNEQIDINTASAEEIERLPGVGPAIAQRIIEARAQHPFSTIEELDAIKGIGPRLLEKIKSNIRFNRD